MRYQLKFFILSLAAVSSSSLWAVSNAGDKKVTKTISVPSIDPWDLDVHTGAGFGTFKNKDEVSKSFGGFLLGLGLYNERLLDRQTAFLSVDFLIDSATQQIIRKGFGIGTSWALLGGKKRTVERLKVGTAVSQNNLSLSWINRVMYDAYSITPSSIGIETLEGANISWTTGLGFQYLIGQDNSVGLSLQQTLLSFSASIEKSTASSTELTLAWRTYL
ncbi:MAG: hypothetical protein V4655_08845 [Bdellovibrionota bacterium]|nr:MAG: hypothetical protein EOP10_21080 [Pseudomonadota bacterium]